MRNLVMCFMLFINSTYPCINEVTKVDKIEYCSSYYQKEFITLNIVINAIKRDIVELKISFYDKDKRKLNQSYYSSALTINGNKNTEAKIPVKVNEKMYLNIKNGLKKIKKTK